MDGERGGIVNAALVDGRVVGDVLDPSMTTVILVYSPTDCLTCGGVLGRWVKLGREQDMAVRLVMTSEPTPQEAASLAFLRVEVVGVLEDEPLEGRSPAAYTFVGKNPDHSAFGLVAQGSLLDELARPMRGVASHSSGR